MATEEPRQTGTARGPGPVAARFDGARQIARSLRGADDSIHGARAGLAGIPGGADRFAVAFLQPGPAAAGSASGAEPRTGRDLVAEFVFDRSLQATAFAQPQGALKIEPVAFGPVKRRRVPAATGGPAKIVGVPRQVNPETIGRRQSVTPVHAFDRRVEDRLKNGDRTTQLGQGSGSASILGPTESKNRRLGAGDRRQQGAASEHETERASPENGGNPLA